ncbi:MAG: Fe-S cluster assembly protein SufB [Pseudomonadota bacterium]|jgi:Fe-S cluster assembly scaffold protein SufB
MSTEEIQQFIGQEYKQGFVTEIEADTFAAGLNEEIIAQLSKVKNEPEWMLEYRLKAFRHWQTMTAPLWQQLKIDKIDYQAISYYSAPKSKNKPKSLDEVDPEILAAYKKLGIPLDEQERLAGVAVDAVFDSVSVATTFKDKLKEAGVIFCPISEAIRDYPELVKEYLSSVVSVGDNFFAALNSAVFTDGSFVYIPKGVRCPMELSTYFRINASNTGQFERTLIIADEGSYVSYLEGCHPAGEQVLTPQGWQAIETLKAGDTVYDHNGQMQKVKALMLRNYRGEMVTVRPVSRHNTFRLTTEHPVLAIKREQVQIQQVNGVELLDLNLLFLALPKWIKANNLQTGDFILIPKNLSEISIDLAECYETENYFIVPIREISYELFDDLVFNIEVENTHSYLVKGVAVHNCSAPQRDENQLHAAVVELVALKNAQIKYSTVQNWYPGDKDGKGGIYNFVTKRADCRGENAKVSWTQVETGSAITWKYPSCVLTGDNSIGEFYSVALTNNLQQADTGTKMIHIGKNTKSTIVSKGISAGKAQNTYRGLVKVLKSAENARNYTQCDSLLVGDQCGAHTFPYIEVKQPTAQVEHEATTSKISEDQLFFCQQRGLSAEDAVSMIVNGFCKQVFKELPMEFAVEAQALLGLSLEGAVG